MRGVNQIRENNGKISSLLLFGARGYHFGSFFFLQVGNPRKLLDGDLDAILTIVAVRRAAGGSQKAQYEQVQQNDSMTWKTRHRVLSI
jgi:hypothetical protein